MELLTAVGGIDDIDTISEEMVKCGCIHAVDSTDIIKQYIKDNDNENIITRYQKSTSYDSLKSKISEVMDILDVKVYDYTPYMQMNMSFDEMSEAISPIYDEAVKYKNDIDRINEYIEIMSTLQNNLNEITDIKYPLYEIRSLKYFKMGIGRVHRQFYNKIEDNIENIPSIIYKLSARKKYITIISFTPLSKISEAYEIFKSLGYEEIVIPEDIGGVPSEIIISLGELIDHNKEIVKQKKDKIKSLNDKWAETIRKCYTITSKYEKMDCLNKGAVNTRNLFYLTGWIPCSDELGMNHKFEEAKDRLLMMFLDEHDVKGLTPPTKLKNNMLIKPFEYLVNMYGTPFYWEIDPTLFISLSYTLLFGAMFGDVGQGLVILLGGIILLLTKRSYSFGGILAGIGLSSAIFGLLYGSVFGMETIIRPMLIKPIDNINTMLTGGIVLGVLLLSIGYALNLVNCFRMRDLEEGLFGREGAAGFLLFLSLLFCAVSLSRYKMLTAPVSAVLILILLLIVMIVLKQPLSRLIAGKKPLYDDSIGNYYVESIFGVIENLLSILSNTISFVRIGAFALNHAGLFIAFSTVSSMIKQKAGSALVMILGNIIIIGLEGLVVLIQCLRLEYYEIFSKFYKGDGIEYDPVCIAKNEKE